MEESIQEKKSVWFRIFRILLWVSTALVALLIVLVLVLNIPAVQTFIAGKFIKNLREKSGAEVSLGSLKIALPNTVNIKDLFLSDKNADTLLYLQSLSVDVSLFRLLHNQVAINSLELENVSGNIRRTLPDSTFNFQFLVDLFSPAADIKPDTVAKPRKPWLIKVNDVHLKNIRATFFDMRGGTDLRVNLGEFDATLKDIDLSKRKISIDKILLKNTSVSIAMSPNAADKEVMEAASGNISPISNGNQIETITSVFLTLNITANQLTIENTGFRLDNNASPKISEGIDYAHMDFNNLNASIRNIKIDNEGYRADFENASVDESCGLSLKNLSAVAEFTDKHAQIKHLKLE
ncbi:MAG: AsmA family protein, partial [Lentimicrobium sp.]|nr:AsmA family protein [Lentimicrobium sp.]